ncbi:hypothetical protein JG687_00015352 [Phytophthora cactorum]|uniref:Uncharacterized protein n=1 Tax=Phytophthora cactorum TaxID=29920 RepID=A0A8T1TW65_9STRA|nr:hypothetical protein JG687_00015352 [Phytophthora cactorum]
MTYSSLVPRKTTEMKISSLGAVRARLCRAFWRRLVRALFFRMHVAHQSITMVCMM